MTDSLKTRCAGSLEFGKRPFGGQQTHFSASLLHYPVESLLIAIIAIMIIPVPRVLAPAIRFFNTVVVIIAVTVVA